MVRVVWAPPVGQGGRFLACERVLRLFLLFFQWFNSQEGLWSPSGCKHPPRQPMELVHGSQPPAWFPSQASCQEGCRGSRSEERILNHIYMCMMQKGKGRGGREPHRNPKRKSVSTPQYKKIKEEEEEEDSATGLICLRCSQIAVLKSSASLSSFSSRHPIARRKSLILL